MNTLTTTQVRNMNAEEFCCAFEGYNVMDMRLQTTSVSDAKLWMRMIYVDPSSAMVRGNRLYLKGRVCRSTDDRSWGWMVITL